MKYGMKDFEDMTLYEIRKVNPDYEKKLRDDAFEASLNEDGY